MAEARVVKFCVIDQVCVYVCKKNLCSRRKTTFYSPDCHGGAMEMYHCAQENMRDFSFTQN